MKTSIIVALAIFCVLGVSLYFFVGRSADTYETHEQNIANDPVTLAEQYRHLEIGMTLKKASELMGRQPDKISAEGTLEAAEWNIEWTEDASTNSAVVAIKYLPDHRRLAAKSFFSSTHSPGTQSVTISAEDIAKGNYEGELHWKYINYSRDTESEASNDKLEQ